MGLPRPAMVSFAHHPLALYDEGAHHGVRRGRSEPLFREGEGGPHEIFFFHFSPFFKSRSFSSSINSVISLNWR